MNVASGMAVACVRLPAHANPCTMMHGAAPLLSDDLAHLSVTNKPIMRTLSLIRSCRITFLPSGHLASLPIQPLNHASLDDNLSRDRMSSFPGDRIKC